MNTSTITGFRLKLYPSDFIKVRAFYEQVLGFSPINEWDRGAQDRGVMLQVGPAIIELLTPEKDYRPVAGADVSLEVSDVRALWHGLQDKADVVFALRDNDWGDSSFCIRDPEGFEITFFTSHKKAIYETETTSTMNDVIGFMEAYEVANNSHDFANVEPFIAPDATYWFTDGSYAGLEEIRQAIEQTFTKIQDEVYEISDLKWPLKNDTAAVCAYRFSWRGIVDGQHQSGEGRGTNVLHKQDGAWQIVHEHLSR